MKKFQLTLLSLIALAVVTLAFVTMSGEAALAACTPGATNGVTANCTGVTVNQGPGATNGYGNGQNNVRLTVEAGASVSGTSLGVNLGTGTTVFNFGTISGGNYGISASFTNLTNYGTISNLFGGIAAVDAPQASNVTNFGNVIGSGFSFIFFANSTLNNAGYIKGNILFDKQGSLINSGTIVDNVTFASNGGPTADIVTVLPGARFGGSIDFGDGADKVNFGPGSWTLKTANFNAGLSTINAGGNPYVVTANRVVVADVSGFGVQNRAMMDIVGWISSVLPDTPVFDRDAGDAFAAITSANRIDDGFASLPASAMGYAPAEPVFKGGTTTDRDGNSIWAKGFGGRREQSTDGHFIGGVTNGYGGALGVERHVSPGLRLGGFVGGSSNKTELYLNAGNTETDTVFGGIYARATSGATFLDLAVIGGHLDNSSKRNIGGGLLLETARADYDGWFLNPSAAIGHRFGLGQGFSVTPALKVRYVAAYFDGYSESGSTANLTVGARDVQALEERAELTLATVKTFGENRVTYRVTGGALAQQRAGNGTIDLALLGQNLVATTPDQKTVIGGYGSAGLDWQVGRTALFAAGEFTSASDSSTTLSGKGGVRVVW
ncbi:MAG: autotransporter protein [Xanthobacteraceae bacterium]|nr:autotransporter protein [Xanthobacteraceae bacterium]